MRDNKIKSTKYSSPPGRFKKKLNPIQNPHHQQKNHPYIKLRNIHFANPNVSGIWGGRFP